MATCCGPSRSNPSNADTTRPQPAEAAFTEAMQPSDFVRVPGGAGRIGTDEAVGHPDDGEGPCVPVDLTPFWISTTAVTTEKFAAFVQETGYRTDAERFGWSFVFAGLATPVVKAMSKRSPEAPWWLQVYGASWHQPTGPGSAANSRDPVVHVSWRDAQAYATFAGRRLPTEAEWEIAAQGGLGSVRYPWGNDFPVGRRARANIFEGTFPTNNTAADGYLGTAPVDTFAPNGYGLHNMVGNVWEWTGDWFSARRHGGRNPTGPASGTAKVIKGGSYLCHDSYCNRYRIAARTSNTPETSTGHTGFRLAGSDGLNRE